MNFFETTWREFLRLAQSPELWITLVVALGMLWVIAHLVAKARIKAGTEPVASAKAAVFMAAPIVAAALAGLLFALSRWNEGHLLLVAIVLLVPVVLAVGLGRPVEVEA